MLFRFTVPDPWGQTRLITILISSSRCIEIPQDKKSISPGALINHRLERGIECVLHGENTRLSLSMCRNQAVRVRVRVRVTPCFSSYHRVGVPKAFPQSRHLVSCLAKGSCTGGAPTERVFSFLCIFSVLWSEGFYSGWSANPYTKLQKKK